MEDRSPGRREYDVDPRVKFYVEERLRDTRHELRTELTSLATVVTAGTLKSSEEHAEVKIELRGLKDEITALKDRSLALDNLRATVRNTAFSLAALIVAAAGLLIGLGH